MKIKMKSGACWMLGLGVIAMSGTGLVRAQDDMDSSDTMSAAGNAVAGAGAMDREGGMMDARAMNAKMLIQTLSEEKTEINTLAAQQARLKQLGTREDKRLAAMWGRWIREHKAAGPKLMALIRQNGGDPMEAKILKQPVLGKREQMLDATHKDHEAAVMTSQMRHGMTNSPAIKTAMRKRANLARKHLRQMMPYHDKHNMMKMDQMSVQG